MKNTSPPQTQTVGKSFQSIKRTYSITTVRINLRNVPLRPWQSCISETWTYNIWTIFWTCPQPNLPSVERVELMDSGGRVMNLEPLRHSGAPAGSVLAARRLYVLLRVCRESASPAPLRQHVFTGTTAQICKAPSKLDKVWADLSDPIVIRSRTQNTIRIRGFTGDLKWNTAHVAAPMFCFWSHVMLKGSSWLLWMFMIFFIFFLEGNEESGDCKYVSLLNNTESHPEFTGDENY